MKKNIDLFLKSLVNHPGLQLGFVFPLLMLIASIYGNFLYDQENRLDWYSVTLIAIITIAIWFSILKTAWEQRVYYDDDEDN